MRILFLFYDLMNLYGENGNIRMLERRLMEQGADIVVDKKTICDEIDFSNYDFIYCGSGTESKRNIVLEYLRKYKEDIKLAIEHGTFMLFTGNSWEMLGKSITLGSKEVIEGLGIFEYTTIEDDSVRLTGDAIFENENFLIPFVGFINKCSKVLNVSNPLFDVKMGHGNDTESKKEGVLYKNFWGTQLIGPILIKNPHFLRYVLKKLLKSDYKEMPYEFEEKGFEITLKELTKRMEH